MITQQVLGIGQVCKNTELGESAVKRAWQRNHANPSKADKELADYSVGFYNHVRLHAKWGYQPPSAYERSAYKRGMTENHPSWGPKKPDHESSSKAHKLAQKALQLIGNSVSDNTFLTDGPGSSSLLSNARRAN